ncbi:MAG: alpha/beta hydrolase-fold protein [Bacteroidota bacterium]
MVSNTLHRLTDGIAGQIDRYEHVDFGALHARNVDVWLPVGYDPHAHPYPLIIAQDGQNLFIPSESFVGIDWGVDEMMHHLISAGEVRPAVVVGVWNSSKRLQEYMPEQPLAPHRYHKMKASFAKRFGGVPCSDAYLWQLINRVIPFVEAEYNVTSESSERFLMGSSMGGLISLYGLCQYSDHFGGAACLSTSLTIIGEALHDYIDASSLDPNRHRVYLDYGVEGETPAYERAMQRLERQFKHRGYREGQLEVVEEPGAPHSEAAWRGRLDRPLRFLLG